MKSAWEEIGKLEPDIKNPMKVIEELFSPITQVTQKMVAFKVQQVNYFPEEVTYSVPALDFPTVTTFGLDLYAPTKNPHPEFGYDPESSKHRQILRYRLLLSPSRKLDSEFELFKFSFPIRLYPVTIFISDRSFVELGSLIKDGKVIVSDEEELSNVINMIIRAETTLKLVRRIMVL